MGEIFAEFARESVSYPIPISVAALFGVTSAERQNKNFSFEAYAPNLDVVIKAGRETIYRSPVLSMAEFHHQAELLFRIELLLLRPYEKSCFASDGICCVYLHQDDASGSRPRILLYGTTDDSVKKLANCEVKLVPRLLGRDNIYYFGEQAVSQFAERGLRVIVSGNDKPSSLGIISARTPVVVTHDGDFWVAASVDERIVNSGQMTACKVLVLSLRGKTALARDVKVSVQLLLDGEIPNFTIK